MTASIAGAGADRRRREQALLLTRGATASDLLRLALSETMLVALAGGAAGLLLAVALGRLAFGTSGFGATTHNSVAVERRRRASGQRSCLQLRLHCPPGAMRRSPTVSAGRREVGHARRPLWAKLWLDVAALAGSALVFWWTGSNGYQLVLAVEGTPQVSVNYYSFLAPILLWSGAGLLAWRLADLLLRRGGPVLEWLVRPERGSFRGHGGGDDDTPAQAAGRSGASRSSRWP